MGEDAKRRKTEAEIEFDLEIGFGRAFGDGRLPNISFYSENGHVNFEAIVLDTDSKEITGLQYLTPQQAMVLSKALRACAIKALEYLGN